MAYNKMLETKFKGDYEAYRKYMRELASKAGKAKVPTKGNGYITVHGHKKNEGMIKDHEEPAV